MQPRNPQADQWVLTLAVQHGHTNLNLRDLTVDVPSHAAPIPQSDEMQLRLFTVPAGVGGNASANLAAPYLEPGMTLNPSPQVAYFSTENPVSLWVEINIAQSGPFSSMSA
jgi:hypothetical protein